MANNNLKVGGLYRHFKGGMYIVRGIAEHTETGKAFVVYEDAVSGKLWVRPYGSFVSRVDIKKYPEATQEYRFELVPDELEPEEDKSCAFCEEAEDEEVCEECMIRYSGACENENHLQ